MGVGNGGDEGARRGRMGFKHHRDGWPDDLGLHRSDRSSNPDRDRDHNRHQILEESIDGRRSGHLQRNDQRDPDGAIFMFTLEPDGKHVSSQWPTWDVAARPNAEPAHQTQGAGSIGGCRRRVDALQVVVEHPPGQKAGASVRIDARMRASQARGSPSVSRL